MKICAIICEFNPFHNGHKYLLERARELSLCDVLLCMMSGSFTQRGDICVMDRHTRARHALLCGADAVLELPAAFSVAPAEIFSQGAIKLLNSIPDICTLAFGCEADGYVDFSAAAEKLLNESETFKKVLNEGLESGQSYIKSYANAFEKDDGEAGLLDKPNNILAVEYAKAIIKLNSKIKPLPIKRVGADFNDNELKDNFSSASAIRSNPLSSLIKENLPDCVYEDFKDFTTENNKYKEFAKLILTRTSAEDLKKVFGCGEGLENRLKSLEELTYEEIIANATGRRYSSSRIKRILCANFLKIYAEDCFKYLDYPLYLKPLAIKKRNADIILSALSQSDNPLILKGRDREKLSKTAKKCLETDDFTHLQRQVIAGSATKTNENDEILYFN